ncbi:MAG: ester cyclase [Polaribacter sp.]
MIYSEEKIYERDGLQQDLPGFDKKYNNIVDYILKITEKIWEEKEVYVINDTYTNDILIHVGARKIIGIDNVIKNTFDTLISFPDRKMGAETVIWSKDGDAIFYSSHRIGSNATNLGKTIFGEATGKKVFFRTIADCKVKNNKIFEEWLVRDNLAIIQQLGFNPVEMAKKSNTYKTVKPNFSFNKTFKDVNKSNLNGTLLTPQEELIYTLFNTIWTAKKIAKIDDFYTDTSTLYTICNNNLEEKATIKNYLELFLNSFKNIKIKLERITSNRLDDRATEIAARWFVNGIYKSGGVLGDALEKEVYIPIITHYHIENQKINKEWMVFDGFDALCQIYAQ